MATRPLILAVTVSLLLLVDCAKQERRRPLGSNYERVGRAEVWRVLPNSPAEALGLQPGDVIISYNEEPVQNFDALEKAIASGPESQANAPISIVLLRGEQELTFQARPGSLGLIPIGRKFSGSLALALKDIVEHFNGIVSYDWLAALTGESFALSGRPGDCWSWWPGTKDGAYLEEIGSLLGLTFRPVFISNGPDPATAQKQTVNEALPAIRKGLEAGQVLLVKGGWPDEKCHLWGIALSTTGSDTGIGGGPAVLGYTLDAGQKLPLSGIVEAVFEVKPKPVSEPDPADIMAVALDHALELGLAYADTGWKSGLDAYDMVIKSMESVPFCPDRPEESRRCFHRLIWALIAAKESANRFWIDMKEALPDHTEIIDEIIGENRAIIGKLEALAFSKLPFGNLESQRKLALTVNEIQLLENELFGFYEELLGEL
ncbi:MAG: PDZ domain-containing protein [candidate division WOR-3 bacterium]